MAETHFDSVVSEISDDGREKRIHTIKQLYWFRDAMGRTIARNGCDWNEYDKRKLLSAIRFNLPYISGREAPGYLLVVGNGCNQLDVYLANVNPGRDIVSGGFPDQPSRLWRLFSEISDSKFSYGFEEKPKERIRFNEIFTTDLAPFLKCFNYPTDCLRIYNLLPNWMGELLQVTADNCEDRSRQNLSVTYIPDKRDGEPITIVTLRHEFGKGWTSSELEKRISTWNFTFSSTVNAC